jgi:hypothetical protein
MHLVPTHSPALAEMRVAIELSARDFDALAADAARNSLCIQEQIVEAVRYCHRNRISFPSAEDAAIMHRLDGEAA